MPRVLSSLISTPVWKKSGCHWCKKIIRSSKFALRPVPVNIFLGLTDQNLSEMFENLGDSELVVEFQRFCGLKWQDRATGSASNRSENVNKNLTLNGSESRHAKENTNLTYDYSPFVHLLFHLSSALGDEQILIGLLSFLYWNIDPRAVMRVYFCLAISLYLGQGAKDLLMCPRPPSPPVIRVEKKYAEEYSMPSTHAMMGMVVPFSLVYFTYERFQYDIIAALIAASMCCCLVGISRVYLGMHSVKDVLCGMAFECAIITVIFPIIKEIALERWCQTSPHVFSAAIILPVMLLLVYPTSTPTSFNTFSDTALVLGIFAGSTLGLRFSAANEKLMMEFLVTTHGISGFQLLWLCLLRFCIGTILLSLTRVIMKWCITSTLSKVLPSNMIMKPLGYKRFVEIPHKFTTYGMVAFNCIFLAPKIFKLIGL